jgi:hypothetical protein
MLRLDFHRLFHTPILYVMLTVSAIIPALLLTTTGLDASGAPADPSGRPAPPSVEHTNVWQLIESTGRSGGADPLDFGGYANINMVFIFAGLLMAIFVAHDYISGFVKNIFSVHPQKADYVISKTVIGIFSGAGMILAYVFGSVIAGLITGQAFDVAVSGLIWCLLSKILLMGVFCALFLGVAVFFRSKLWITIVFTFLLGMTLYPAASVATLDSTPATTLASLLAGTVGAVGLGAVSTLILNRRDLA